jgi:hypothetical protein
MQNGGDGNDTTPWITEIIPSDIAGKTDYVCITIVL